MGSTGQQLPRSTAAGRRAALRRAVYQVPGSYINLTAGQARALAEKDRQRAAATATATATAAATAAGSSPAATKSAVAEVSTAAPAVVRGDAAAGTQELTDTERRVLEIWRCAAALVRAVRNVPSKA